MQGKKKVLEVSLQRRSCLCIKEATYFRHYHAIGHIKVNIMHVFWKFYDLFFPPFTDAVFFFLCKTCFCESRQRLHKDTPDFFLCSAFVFCCFCYFISYS